MTDSRRVTAHQVRADAAYMAEHRDHPKHKANGDEQRYSAAHYPMSFTKGLEHDPLTGVVDKPQDFEAFRQAIDRGEIAAFTKDVPVPREEKRRVWEAPTAGTAYDLQGPDAQAVTMAAAPELCSDELAFEMAEVYELALVRDVPFTTFDTGGGSGQAALNNGIARMNGLAYAMAGFPNRPRTNDGGALTRQTAFRGGSPGVSEGPYLSQFMVMGNDIPQDGRSVADGHIRYGANTIDQRVLAAKAGEDHMQTWADWLRVQDGYDVNNGGPGQTLSGRHFICTPRDLATYVHFDALYQAYLNACLLLLNMGAPFDPGFANLSGMRQHYDISESEYIDANAGGFALYGGPHILTMVTEVATRALKAVRYQKFNVHLRLRPEALAARIEKAEMIDKTHPATCSAFGKLEGQVGEVVKEIRQHNDDATGDATALLPMAFAEGSPMHPTYGAGHATVAGACVTMLKAFFDCGAVLVEKPDGSIGFTDKPKDAKPVHFIAEKGKDKLTKCDADCPLTLEGELNKLAANISIGRNMAGVHYYSDYYDSVRMGEEIALGILEEQALCYPTDAFVMSVSTFDGDVVRIGAR